MSPRAKVDRGLAIFVKTRFCTLFRNVRMRAHEPCYLICRLTVQVGADSLRSGSKIAVIFRPISEASSDYRTKVIINLFGPIEFHLKIIEG